MERNLMKGNEALAEAAIRAGCKCFFGYPITPQTEISAYMAKHAEGRRRFPPGGERDSGYQYGIRLRKLRRTVHDIQFIAGNLP